MLALLGIPGFRVEQGHIQLIRLAIPWSSLATGKVSLEVSGIHIQVGRLHFECHGVEVEQMAESRSKEELIRSMREAHLGRGRHESGGRRSSKRSIYVLNRCATC